MVLIVLFILHLQLDDEDSDELLDDDLLAGNGYVILTNSSILAHPKYLM